MKRKGNIQYITLKDKDSIFLRICGIGDKIFKSMKKRVFI